MTANFRLIQKFKELIPKLCGEMHKGQNGRVGLIGGSKEYSGAPYFSSISCLRVGADLSYVLTAKDAAAIIKSYSPEMIVLPVLDCDNNELEIRNWLSKCHSIIIGPGLGRSETASRSVKIAVKYARSQNIPIVIDADGLFVINYDTSLVSGYKKCILTPNFMEFKRLYESLFNQEYEETRRFSSLESQCEAVKNVSIKLDNVTILKKGKTDIISDGEHTVQVSEKGGLKRSGGIGDILSGTLGTFIYWCDRINKPDLKADYTDCVNKSNLVAATAACTLVRECSLVAFNKFHRSVLAVDIIDQIGETFYKMFDQESL